MAAGWRRGWTRTTGSGKKYGNAKAEIDGEFFDSRKEARRYLWLKYQLDNGKISDLQRQVRFELIPAQREPDTVGPRGGVKKGRTIELAVDYVADFVYKDAEGNQVVEDVKGYKGGGAYAVFSLKRKLLLQLYGIRIKEV